MIKRENITLIASILEKDLHRIWNGKKAILEMKNEN